MGKKIERFYLMGKTGLTILESQVYGWMNSIYKKSIPTSIISIVDEINPNLDFVLINEKIGGNFLQVKKKMPFIREIYYLLLFINFYKKASKNADIVIFQTRIPSIAISLILLRFFTKAKIIYDARGATIEEFKYTNQNKKISLKRQVSFNFLILQENWLVKYSNCVFTVSETLKRYYLSKIKKVNSDKFCVVPCAADKLDFYYSEDERQQMRNKFHLSEKKVILYSGRLDKEWNIPENIFKFYDELSAYHNNLVLFLLTPDYNIAQKLIKKYNIDEMNVRIKHDSYQNVRKYLNMVDFGLLLRKDAVMNHVSSPTKFAEYQMCGLPVFISDSVHDYAEMIRKNGFGLVVKNCKLEANQQEQIARLNDMDRVQISEWAALHLSKQVFVDQIINIYKHL